MDKQTSADSFSFNHILTSLSIDKKTCLFRLAQCPAHNIIIMHLLMMSQMMDKQGSHFML